MDDNLILIKRATYLLVGSDMDIQCMNTKYAYVRLLANPIVFLRNFAVNTLAPMIESCKCYCMAAFSLSLHRNYPVKI